MVVGQVGQYASADYNWIGPPQPGMQHGRSVVLGHSCADETFSANLKMARRRDYANAAEAMRAITDYSVGFCSARLPSTRATGTSLGLFTFEESTR
jgi:hypothetical protein